MALFEHGILGRVKGSIGDVVVKNNKGTDYASKKPKEYKKTESIPLIECRSEFAVRASIFRFLTQSPLIKFIWEYSKLPGKYPYNKMFSKNYLFVTKDYITTSLSILPDNLFVSIKDVTITDEALSFEFKLGDAFSTSSVPPYYFIAFVYMCCPVDECSKKGEVKVLLEKEEREMVINKDDYNLYKFEVEDDAFKIMHDYKKVMVFPAIVSQNSKGKPVWGKSKGFILKGDPDPVTAANSKDIKPVEPYKSFILSVK